MIIQLAAALAFGLVVAAPASPCIERCEGLESGRLQSDVDVAAQQKLESARVALAQRQYDAAGRAVLEVMRMAGASQRRKGQAYRIGCDLGMQTRDWELAKTMCDKVLTFADADKDDRTWASGTLQAIRKQAPQLFK